MGTVSGLNGWGRELRFLVAHDPLMQEGRGKMDVGGGLSEERPLMFDGGEICI
jgi:hypothetical protein